MTDVFTFHIPKTERPYTRRGVLSVVNILFDLLGFLAPITIQGWLLLREMMVQGSDWDSSLPESFKGRWMDWQNFLHSLADIRVLRTYSSMSLSDAQSVDLCVFSDASVKTISAVAYVRVVARDGLREVGFVLEKLRLAPWPDLTVPRLELCAAVMAVEIAEVITKEIEMELNSVSFYTDSKVVLDYIHNQSRCFYIYVNNRVQRIKQFTKPEQWHCVPSDENPADHGSCSVPASKLLTTTWLTGPPFLHGEPSWAPEEQISFELVHPDDDKEIRPEVNTLYTNVSENNLSSNQWERFSNWKSAVKAVAHLSHIAYCFAHPVEAGEYAGWHIGKNCISVDSLEKAEREVIKSVQQKVYSEEFRCIQANRNISKQSSLIKLNPIIDSDGLLRVGGRIRRAGYEAKEKNPVIIPGDVHISTLLIRHYHERVQHQGRHFTEGAIRASGLWIVGGRRLISKVLSQCVTCRRLRGKVKEQQMSDLPAERLQVDPPFSYVGMDMFGPWEVAARRTRGSHASSKRGASFHCVVQPNNYDPIAAFGACNEMGISVPGKDSVQEFL
ncbi:Protein CASC3 [Labeo rohita]|uniref:Protein CASC3 n=1 Tax=Labeo rohita TaxID=84645 RepID=A0ABQ8L7A2_LABRO|nr:Protein CASC3 [Labeo rohita]